MQNPPVVLSGLTRPSPLSLGRIALLKKIESPFLGAPRTAAFTEILPSLYLQSLPLKQAITAAYCEEIVTRAIQWAQTLSLEDYQSQVNAINAAITDFFGALPRPEEVGEGKPKKA